MLGKSTADNKHKIRWNITHTQNFENYKHVGKMEACKKPHAYRKCLEVFIVHI